jgi:hypothetical protein
MAITVPLKVKDETDQIYLGRNPTNRYKEMEKTLETFKDLDPSRRYLIITPEMLKTIEDHLKLQIGSPEELLALLKRLTSYQVGGIEVALNETQLQVLSDRAKYWNREDPQAYVKEELTKALNHMVTGHYAVSRG